jgi:hypothetical protein
VHGTDGVSAIHSRIAAADEAMHAFGIATESGPGRRDPATIAARLGLHVDRRSKARTLFYWPRRLRGQRHRGTLRP